MGKRSFQHFGALCHLHFIVYRFVFYLTCMHSSTQTQSRARASAVNTFNLWNFPENSMSIDDEWLRHSFFFFVEKSQSLYVTRWLVQQYSILNWHWDLLCMSYVVCLVCVVYIYNTLVFTLKCTKIPRNFSMKSEIMVVTAVSLKISSIWQKFEKNPFNWIWKRLCSKKISF